MTERQRAASPARGEDAIARADAEDCFRAALAAVDPVSLIERTVCVEGESLIVEHPGGRRTYDLRAFGRVLAFGAGKASARMALGLEAALGDRIAGGLVVVKRGYLETLRRVRALEASHPVPDESSAEAAEAALAFARSAGPDALVVCLTSGGASALLCAPASFPGCGLSLPDKAETTRLLLASGAPIGEINVVRKHLSRVKGGRLADAFGGATLVNLVLSDVVDDDLSVIASGILTPDPSTYADALAALETRGILHATPAAARGLLERGARGDIPETPKPGDPVFSRAESFVLGGNRIAAQAAAGRAAELGYRVTRIDEPLVGEACDAALRVARAFATVRSGGTPACLVAGGETTVTLRGEGRGGRCQELALAFLADARSRGDGLGGACLLSASTDGGDGPTDAAGAFACQGALESAAALGLDPQDFLDRNDSYGFFDRIGHHLKTGPTNTNVCDLQIALAR